LAVRPGSAPYLVILFRCSSDPRKEQTDVSARASWIAKMTKKPKTEEHSEKRTETEIAKEENDRRAHASAMAVLSKKRQSPF
jgi:hypothetical protein